ARGGHTAPRPALAGPPDGKGVFSAGWATTVRVWDVAPCEPIILLNSHAMQVHTIALSRNGKWLAAADSSNSVHLWDTDSHRTRHVIREQVGEIRCLAFGPDNNRLAWGGPDPVARLEHARSSSQGRGSVRPLSCGH